MKTTLTIEQSAELIKRGVSSDKASKRATRQVADSRGREIEKLRLKRWKDCVPYEKATMTNLRVGLIRFEHKEIFTLADLLSLLPKHISFANAEWYLNIQWDISWGKWCVQYLDFDHDDEVVKEEEAPELIDALYLLTLAVINHVKLD